MKASKPIAIILCIAMAFSLLPAAAFADENGADEEVVYLDFEMNTQPSGEDAYDDSADEGELLPGDEEFSEEPGEDEVPSVDEETEESFGEDEEPSGDEKSEETEESGEGEEVSGDDESEESAEEGDAPDENEDEDEEDGDEIPRQPEPGEDDPNDFEASTANCITNPAMISGSDYTGDANLAAKLDAIFNGSASIFYDKGCTNPVNTRLGTHSVPDDNNWMYIGRRGQNAVWSATSCWVLANGAYFTLFGEIIADNNWADQVAAPRSERIPQAIGKSVSYQNFVNWGVRNGVGALVRAGGHSFLVLGYNSSGITYLDGNGDGNGLVAVRNVGWGSVRGTIEYIGQPKQSTMNSLYPGDGHPGGSVGNTEPMKLDAPAVTAAANYAGYVKVIWESVKGAEMYRLSYRQGTGSWIKVCDTPGTSANVTSVKDGETYTFKVECYSKDGKTKLSEESNRIGQMRLTTPAITVNRFGTAGEAGGFTVKWTPTVGGSCYKIYYRETGGTWALYTMIPKSANTLFCNIKESITNTRQALPDIIPGRTYEFMVLTATSQASVTSGFPTSFESVLYPVPSGGKVGYINSNAVNVRSGPGADYEIVCTVYFGTSLIVYGQPENRYCRVSVNGYSGYVFADYINYTN